jgi:hypothetical protein
MRLSKPRELIGVQTRPREQIFRPDLTIGIGIGTHYLRLSVMTYLFKDAGILRIITSFKGLQTERKG